MPRCLPLVSFVREIAGIEMDRDTGHLPAPLPSPGWGASPAPSKSDCNLLPLHHPPAGTANCSRRHLLGGGGRRGRGAGGPRRSCSVAGEEGSALAADAHAANVLRHVHAPHVRAHTHAALPWEVAQVREQTQTPRGALVAPESGHRRRPRGGLQGLRLATGQRETTARAPNARHRDQPARSAPRVGPGGT